MIRRWAISGLALLLLIFAGLLWQSNIPVVVGQASAGSVALGGKLTTAQGEAIPAAEVLVYIDGEEDPVVETESQEDGSWQIELASHPQSEVVIVVERHHFQSFERELDEEELTILLMDNVYILPETIMDRRVTPGFWVAGIVFVFVLILIAFEKYKNALAALVGITAIFLITYLVGALLPEFYVIDFERALTYINWEVIFLVLGMMIIVGIIESTGIFQWLAFMAYRASRGRISLLIIVLIMITSVASALLDNVTTMLLMAPISIQIALALNISPMALLIPEILASNVAGISTLIGTPTNILIGSYAGIGFNDFLINQTPGVLLASVGMTAYILFYYRKEISRHSGGISPALYDRLQKNAEIKDPSTLTRSGVVFSVMLFFFAFGEQIHMVPAVTALVGATILLMWVEPDIDKMLAVVDWATLLFFMALFMLVGAVQEVGILAMIAVVMGGIIGESITLGIIVLVIGVGLMSFFIANVPLAAAMLPVVRFLSTTIPGAGSNVFYYALSMGAAMGGNGTLIGGETNLMTMGIAERAGYPIGFMDFLKIGIPVTLITLASGTAWLYVRFVLFGG